jgi:hypothetical protein
MCDAVQAESYEINGMPVSNFLLPLYFTYDSEPGSRNDFLSTIRPGGDHLTSFGVNPGGYIGFYDPRIDDHATYFADNVARQRAQIKSQVGLARRGIRYKSQTKKPLPTGCIPLNMTHLATLVDKTSNLVEGDAGPGKVSEPKRVRPAKKKRRQAK